MTKTSLILLVFTFFFGIVGAYVMYFSSGGADGLSNFIPLVFVGVLFVCFLLAFILSLFLNQSPSGRKKWLLGGIIALPILGLLSVVGVFGYFTFDYNSRYATQVEESKSVLETLRFEDKDFGVAFTHISGRVSTFENGMPIPTGITPEVQNGMLVVPSDNETYLEPDVLISLEIPSTKKVSGFLEDLKKKLELTDIGFEEVSLKSFPRLPSSTELWVAQEPQVSYQDRVKLVTHFLPERTDFPDLIYFIKSQERPERLWVLVVSGKVFSSPASVEKLSTTNFEDRNLWFHTLRFVQ